MTISLSPIKLPWDATPEERRDTLAAALDRISADFQIEAKRNVYLKDPVLWARERLGIELWSIQASISESLRDNKKTIVKSCHASGKTFLAAILACWWIDVHPPEETMVVSTAPTTRQVNKLLWEYIRKMHRNNNLTGTVNEAAEWKSEQRDVIGFGTKPADTNIHGFNGVHRTYVLALIDEACGVPQTLWTGIEAITTGSENRALAIGNPDDPATEFGRIFLRNDPTWEKFTITAYDTPNFTGEVDKLGGNAKQNLLDPAWVEEKKNSWGESSARFRSKVLAEFPVTADENLFPPLVLMSAVEASVLPAQDVRPVLGVDVARFGNDKTTVVMNYGGVCEVLGSWNKEDTVESARRVHELAVKHGVSEVRVDDTGVGAGVTDQLTHMAGGQYLVIRMVGSAASPDLRKWYNARAYWFDMLREKMMPGYADENNARISLPGFDTSESDPKTLYEELEGIKIKFLRGALLIESKDEMRKRKVKSPDFADALAYACADVDVESPLAGLAPGDVVTVDPMDEFDEFASRGFVVSPW